MKQRYQKLCSATLTWCLLKTLWTSSRKMREAETEKFNTRRLLSSYTNKCHQEEIYIVKTLVERAEEISTTRARRDRQKKHVLKVLVDNKLSFTVYDYYDATVLLQENQERIWHTMSVIESRRQLSKKDNYSSSNADSSCRAAQEKVRRFVPAQVQFKPLKTVDFIEDARCNYRKV